MLLFPKALYNQSHEERFKLLRILHWPPHAIAESMSAIRNLIMARSAGPRAHVREKNTVCVVGHFEE